ncbi:unnamed protein product [Allacma fusca]|uniref:Uncharacterized protein n=1 Tax=Allacma fusca TaxID=39272 RepID=A0A8J2Q131_9HEXA|nr:unnamed protein product [Allacma fusca]
MKILFAVVGLVLVGTVMSTPNRGWSMNQLGVTEKYVVHSPWISRKNQPALHRRMDKRFKKMQKFLGMGDFLPYPFPYPVRQPAPEIHLLYPSYPLRPGINYPMPQTGYGSSPGYPNPVQPMPTYGH